MSLPSLSTEPTAPFIFDEAISIAAIYLVSIEIYLRESTFLVFDYFGADVLGCRLIVVEIEDARLASSVTEMLMGTEVPPRRQFIYENAVDAELDI